MNHQIRNHARNSRNKMMNRIWSTSIYHLKQRITNTYHFIIIRVL